MIKAEAKRLGFFNCGIAQVRELSETRNNYENWIKFGFNAQMDYMQNNFEKRLNPELLVENSKSIIVVLLPYLNKETQKNPEVPIISKYAYGEDYHFVMKDKLSLLFDFININIKPINGRIFTDSAPVAEKLWAEIAGLGWQGKNSNLITRNGSFFFIGEIICDIDLEYDSSAKNYCGTCTKCIDSCPTKAILSPAVVDANLCISYQTIENKTDIPDFLKDKFQNRVFGCDICQDVCPYNKKAVFTSEERFFPLEEILNFSKEDWINITEESFNKIFKKSPLKRAKYKGFIRNLNFLYGK